MSDATGNDDEEMLRRRVGWLTSAFGWALLLLVLAAWLESRRSGRVTLPAQAWSWFFYGHFVAFVTCGLGLQGLTAARSKLFYGGPLIDFLLGVAGYVILESVAAQALHRGTHASWLALLPGLGLVAFGRRLSTGRPLLS